MELSRCELSNTGSMAIRMPSVLTTVATHLPPESLRALRQTCMEWNVTFLSELPQQNKYVNLCNSECWDKCDHKDDHVRMFTELMRTRTTYQIPFSKYGIAFVEHATEIGEAGLLDFFTVCGQSVKSLDVICRSRWGGGPTVDYSILRRVLFGGLVPELEELEFPLDTKAINGLPAGTNNGTSSNPLKPLKLKRITVYSHAYLVLEARRFLQEILRSTVELQCFDASNQTYNNVVLRDLRDFAPGLNNLKELIIENLDESDLQCLTELASRKVRPLRLTRFETVYPLHNPRERETSKMFCRFLLSQAPSLTQLLISLDDGDQSFCNHRYFEQENERNDELVPISIPKLPKLRHLVIDNYHWVQLHEIPIQFKGFSRAMELQSLRKLELGPGRREAFWNTWDSSFYDDLAVCGITELVLQSVPWDKLSEFASLFPGVITLVLDVYMEDEETKDMATLATVWTNWPGLQNLSLQPTLYSKGFWNLNQFLSGIPHREGKHFLRQHGRGRLVTQEDAREFSSKYKTVAGIADLNQLRTFELDMGNESRFHLSDLGGYLGFGMASPTLQRIVVRGTPENKGGKKGLKTGPGPLSAECVAFLRTTFGMGLVLNFVDIK